MAAATVRVRGLTDLRRDLRRAGSELAKDTRKALKEAADPVRREAQFRFAGTNARSAAGYRVAVRARGVAVEQRLRRTTGQHPEWGSLQMRTALLPALLGRQEDVLRGLENMIDRLASHNGFH